MRGRTVGQKKTCTPLRRRNVLVFVLVGLVWVSLDYASKRYFDGFFVPGDVAGGPFLGLFRFQLVHNTGAAWGMFNQSTNLLTLWSVVVCILLLVYLFVAASHTNVAQTLGLALVFSGGLGNIIDRVMQGYVVDFIDLNFMSFPVFNVADIGVTCGFILFILGLLGGWRQGHKADNMQASEH